MVWMYGSQPAVKQKIPDSEQWKDVETALYEDFMKIYEDFHKFLICGYGLWLTFIVLL